MTKGKKTTVLGSALVMASATMISRVLGLVREQLIAAYFGASGLTDAFYIAYRIPNLFRDLFAEGAFSAAFVPNFVKARQESKESARLLFWELFFLLFLLVGSISLMITFGAETLIDLFAPTFSEDLQKYQIAIGLTKIMASFILWTSLAALMMGALNALKIFFYPALAPAFFNLVMIGSIFIFYNFLSDRGYEPIYCLGIGVVLGGIGQFLIQLPVLIKHGYGFVKPKSLVSKRVGRVLALLGPGLVGFAATQLNLIVNTILASGSAIGAVSWLSYAFRLFQLPVGILSVSLGNSNLVYFANDWKAGNFENAKATLQRSFQFSTFMMLPIMALIVIFSQEIVSIIFQHGKFGIFSTVMTAKALTLYAIGLPCYGIYKILVPVFYTLDKARAPVITSILSILFNIAFCTYLTPRYGFEVLPLGTTLSMVLNMVIQSLWLKKEIRLTWNFFFNFRVAKYFLATGLIAVLAWWLRAELLLMEFNFTLKLLSVSFTLAFCLLCYIFMIYLFGERQALDNLLSRLRRKD